MKRAKKVLVIGIDGADFNLIMPWIDEGVLPNLKSFFQKGTWGRLESCLPFVTFPAWKCLSTGRDPGQLGVYWWQAVDFPKKKFVQNDSRSFIGEEIWDILSDKQKRSIVINLPTTYPAKKIKGILISGPPIGERQKAFYPKRLVNQYQDYKFFPEATFRVEKDKLIKEVETIIDQKAKVALKLLTQESWDLFWFTFFLIDDIQHFFWSRKIKEKKYKDVLKKFWIKIDGYIGEFVRQTPRETIIFIVSDHGFTSLKKVVYLNEWLLKKGYLVLTNRNALARKIDIETVSRLAERLKLLGIIKKILPKKIKEKVLSRGKLSGGFTPEEEDIDWEKTKMIALTEGPVYINRQGFGNKADFERFKKRYQREIANIKDREEKLFEKVHLTENLYMDLQGLPPDFIIEPRRGVEISGKIGFNKVIGDQHEGWLATHRRKGIFFGFGREVEAKRKIRAQLIDLGPTILHIFGLSIPGEMKGKVLSEIFKPGSSLKSQAIRRKKRLEKKKPKRELLSEKEEEKIKERLKALGYL